MYYNINFEIAAILVLAAMLLGRRNLFKSEDKTIRMFMGVLIMTIGTTVFNIVAALSYAQIIPVDDSWMLVIETAYMLLGIYSCYFMLRLVCVRTGFESEVFRIANFTYIAVMSVVLLINIAGHFMFYYEDHVFVGTSWFHLDYLIYVILFLEIAFVLIAKGKKLRRRVVILTSSIFFCPVGCIIIQFINDRLLLSGIGATVALFIYSFTLGEEDFEELQATLEELQRVKEQSELSRAEAEKVERVKELFIEQISNRFDAPLSEVIRISEEMKEFQDNPLISEYIEQINEAGLQLQTFVGELNE